MSQLSPSPPRRPQAGPMPGMTRSTSYVLVSSSLPDPPTPPTYDSPTPRRHPRYYYLLPALAALDCVSTCVLAFLLCQQQAPSGGGGPGGDVPSSPGTGGGGAGGGTGSPKDPAAPYWDRQRLILAVTAVAIARGCTFAIVGFSKRIRELGVIVAAICILSALYNVSVANILFQARGKPDIVSPPVPRPTTSPNATYALARPDGLAALTVVGQPQSRLLTSTIVMISTASVHLAPTMAFLISTQMAFTLAEWMLYIGIVGVRVPPGGNPVKAKRWARTLARDSRYRDGADAASLYVTDSDNDGDEEQEEDDDDVEDAHAESETAALSQDDDRRNVSRRGASSASESRSLHQVPRDNEGSRPTSPFLSPQGQQKPTSLKATAADERTLLQSPQRGYGAAGAKSTTPQRQRKQSQELIGRGSMRGHRVTTPTPRSPTVPFPSARDSPRTAELGLVGRRIEDMDGFEGRRGDGNDDDDDDLDPDDIIDISSDRRLSRHASRRRLALAAHPERRVSGGALSGLTLGLGSSGSGGAAHALSKPLGIALGSGGGGGVGLFGRQKADGSSADPNSAGATPRSWTAIKGKPSRPGGAGGGPPRSASTSASHTADLAAADAASSEVSHKKHRKLPAWLSRSKTSPAKVPRHADEE
ncbi:uncharacterized protein PFL1_02318 [Pseudozyma flocculosa PF-1]|uniref:Uncharacterized protein n=1 Tax=Pseudozyma flocculosa TaxID=84751 RepID=A0A5C3F6S2_9BASI|nr:uncharacterized protein PFL1_02318 [Pseudozyma flocculosa PF-1]EPQ30202.1 hypothetical protein PFL1_02318 [Pseudozyma flocculosa PF-1]SPO39870.1 uncharacterized protein PSFLO_05351 [Pseudozyma flocculosa]